MKDLSEIRKRHDEDHDSTSSFWLDQRACDLHNDRATLLAAYDEVREETIEECVARLTELGVSHNSRSVRFIIHSTIAKMNALKPKPTGSDK